MEQNISEREHRRSYDHDVTCPGFALNKKVDPEVKSTDIHSFNETVACLHRS
jgi:hypothetical protein